MGPTGYRLPHLAARECYHYSGRMPRTRAWTDDQLRAAVKDSTSWRGVCRELGISQDGNGYKSMQKVTRALELDTSHFRGHGWNKGQGAGRDTEAQRASKRRYYQNNRQLYRTRNIERRRRMIELVRHHKNRPCADCNGWFPSFVMEFDHRDGETKSFNIGSAAREIVSVERMLAEIAKCDIVCCLCHRLRTARRAGWTNGAEPPLQTELLAADE